MTKDLTVGNPFHVIVSYLIPVYFSLLLQSLYGVVDSVIVGQTLGADALGGISATGNISAVTLGLFTGLNAGFCIPIANAFGAGDYSRLRRLVSNGAYLCAGTAFISVAVLSPAAGAMLASLNTTPEHFPHAQSYLRVILLGAPFSLLYNFCGGIVRSMGDSKMPTIFLVLSAIVNGVMDLVFILVFRMGTAGAALATVMANAAAGFSCLFYMMRKISALRFSRDEWRPDKKILSLLLRNGIPMGMQSILVSLGPLFQRPALNNLGADVLNSLSVSGRINGVLMCPLSTLGHSIGYYFGQNVGAGKPERIRQGFRVGITLSVLFCVASTLLALFFSAPLTALFLQDPEPALVEKVRISLLITNSAAVFCGLCSTYKPAIQAMGYTSLVLIPCIAETFVQIFGAFVLIPRFGFIGANVSTALAWITVSCAVIPMGYRCLKKLQDQVHT